MSIYIDFEQWSFVGSKNNLAFSPLLVGFMIKYVNI